MLAWCKRISYMEQKINNRFIWPSKKNIISRAFAIPLGLIMPKYGAPVGVSRVRNGPRQILI